MTESGETGTDLTGPAEEPTQPPLRSRHPAELTSLLAGVLVLAAALGLDLTDELLYAGIAVIAGIPALVTWLVGIVRDTVRALDE